MSLVDGRAHQISDQQFAAMVQTAIDGIPEEFRRELEKVPVVISDRGEEHHAYGRVARVEQGGRKVRVSPGRLKGVK